MLLSASELRELIDRLEEIRAMEDADITPEIRTELTDGTAKLNAHLDAVAKRDADVRATTTARDAAVTALASAASPADNQDSNPVRAAPDSTPTVTNIHNRAADRPFADLGDQLRAIYRAGMDMTATPDVRLLRVNAELRAISGLGEAVDSDGGFALQPEFAGSIMETAAQVGQVLPRVDTYIKGPGGNTVSWNHIDETDVSSTVFGGIQVYWAAEAATVAATKPKLSKRNLELQKLMGLMYATDELLADTSFASQVFERGFSTAIARRLEGDILNGTGAGQPLGIIQSPATVAVAKESGQAADTIVYENIVKMYHRMLPDSIPNAVWLIHPDAHEQLEFMELAVGTGGVPVFLPAAGGSTQGAANSPLATLKGRPIISTDHCSALGDLGDIIFADLSDYLLLRKGGNQTDVSIHVRFLYDESTFRIVARANGMPKRESALTIKNSASTRSTFVQLAARA